MDLFDPVTGRTWDGLTREQYWQSIASTQACEDAAYASQSAHMAYTPYNIYRTEPQGHDLEAMFPPMRWAGTIAVSVLLAATYSAN